MSKSSSLPVLVLALILGCPWSSRAQISCQQSPAGVTLEGAEVLVFQLAGREGAGLSLHLTVKNGGTGGVASITDGTSNTILLAEKFSRLVTCDDADLDGVIGISALRLGMRDIRTGSLVALVIVPVDGEINSGEEQVSLTLGSRTTVETARIRGQAGAAPGDLFNRLEGRFRVTADGGQTALGTWTKISGLTIAHDTVDYQPGGGTLILHREAGSDTRLVEDWVKRVTQTGERTTLVIEMLDQAGEPVSTWNFTEAWPKKYHGVALDGNTPDVPIETLVLAHEGFVVERGRMLSR